MSEIKVWFPKEAEELDLLRGDLSKWVEACDQSRLGLVLPMPPLVAALHEELEKAKAENAATIELLTEMDQAGPFIVRRPSLLEKARTQLARLRSVMEGKP